MVIWVTGFGSAAVTATGALAGGFVCDRMSRKYAYLLAGLLSGLAAAGMTWLDGVGYSHFGPRGLLGTDAIANVAAVAVGAIFVRYVSEGSMAAAQGS
jgi:hypothetical protein